MSEARPVCSKACESARDVISIYVRMAAICARQNAKIL
jgi:hypothetical protein